MIRGSHGRSDSGHAVDELDVGHVVHVPREGRDVLGELLGVGGNPLEEEHGLLGGGGLLHAPADAVVAGVLLLDRCLQRANQAKTFLELTQQVGGLISVGKGTQSKPSIFELESTGTFTKRAILTFSPGSSLSARP